MLESMFGETGAVVAQYVITLVVILALVVLVIWLVRRYAAGNISTSTRGRLPRLAIVDALAVDNRHRLVLIRRDNVEHLVLIGGTTDLLIEPSIVRTRVTQRPTQAAQPQPSRPAPAATAAPAPPPPPAPPAAEAPSAAPARRAALPPAAAAGDEPIPFPPRQSRQVAARPARAMPHNLPVRPAESANDSGREAVFRRPSLEPEMQVLAEETDEDAIEPVPRADRAEHPAASVSGQRSPLGALEELTAAVSEAESAEADHPSAFAPLRRHPGNPTIFDDEPAMAEEEPRRSSLPEGAGAATGAAPKVSDREKEMARLLGEISSSRSS